MDIWKRLEERAFITQISVIKSVISDIYTSIGRIENIELKKISDDTVKENLVILLDEIKQRLGTLEDEINKLHIIKQIGK